MDGRHEKSQEIDALIYRLFDLMEEEIAMVETTVGRG